MANSYLEANMTGNTASTRMTFSCWIKINKVDEDGRIFGAQANACHAYFNGDGRLNIDFAAKDSGSVSAKLLTTRRFRDTNAWYHIVFALDTTLGTADDRIKLWVNGVQETAFDTRTNPGQNDTYAYGQSGYYNVGARSNNTGSAGHYFEGYISHAAYVDGSALAPTVFGQTDSTSGIWKFKNPSGVTWGDNGFHLKFENSGNLGLDSSGEGNNFTTNGNLKQAIDNPSNVYCVINDLTLSAAQVNITYGNLSKTNTPTSNAWRSFYGTMGASSGKYYCELKIDNIESSDPNNFRFGIIDSGGITNQANNNSFHNESRGYAYNAQNGNKGNNGSFTSYGNSFTTGDIIGCAVDLDNHKIYWSKNGTWQNSGDPTSGSTGTGSAFDLASGYTYLPAIAQYYGNEHFSLNFGNGFFGITAISSAGSNGNGSLFEYDCPTGYYAWNTKNINTYG